VHAGNADRTAVHALAGSMRRAQSAGVPAKEAFEFRFDQVPDQTRQGEQT